MPKCLAPTLGLILVQPVSGFQGDSVHSMAVLALMAVLKALDTRVDQSSNLQCNDRLAANCWEPGMGKNMLSSSPVSLSLL